MTILNLNQINKSFATQNVLNNITLQINENRCYGLIGANGCGKTTFLNIITDQLEATSGSITKVPELRIGYVTQQIQFSAHITVNKAMLSYYQPILDQLRIAEDNLSNATDKQMDYYLKKYQQARDAYDTIEGDSLKNRCETILKALGLGDKGEQLVDTLSGGEKSTLGLANALLMRPDLLILDEPGNHLDFMGLAWLESFLLKFKGTILLVSHNRYLLDNLCDEILDLDNCKLTTNKGNYSQYRMDKLKKAIAMQADYKANQRRLAQLEALVKKFEQIARSRPDPTWGKRLRARKSQLNREKKTAVDKPVLNQEKINLELKTEISKAKVALKINQLDLGFDQKLLFKNASLELYCGEKAALIGPNGCGKTTLVKKIIQQGSWNNPVIQIGPSLKVGYLSQNQDIFNSENSIEDEIRKLGALDRNQIFHLLAPFLFSYQDLEKKIRNLSGGEKNRLQLARLKYLNANFLILDEPTNHLDIPSREAIEEALIAFEGTILVISHDRYFLDKIITRVIEVKDFKLISHPGNFTQFWANQIGFKPRSNGRLSKRKAKSNSNNKYKSDLSFELEELEKRIEKLENDKIQLEKNIVEAFQLGQHQNGRKHNQELEKLHKILDNAYQKWEKMLS